MGFISALAIAFTIESGVISSIQAMQKGKELFDESKMAKLSAVIDYNKVSSDLEIYAEAADEYIARRNAAFTAIITDEDRNEFRTTFYDSHPDMTVYEYYIDPILNKYLDALEDGLKNNMSLGEKFISTRLNSVNSKVDVISERLGELLVQADERERTLLKSYYDSIRYRFEALPDEDKQELVGDLSLRESYIDVTVDMGKKVKGESAIEVIEKWCCSTAPGVKVLYGEPGHGKTTIGYRLVYDYIAGKLEKKAFFFPLVSSTYSIVSHQDTIDIIDALRLDKFNADSKLDRVLINNSLIILDGYDELQVALGNGSQFSSLPRFFSLLSEFAEAYNAHVLLTTRSASINPITPGMKPVNKALIKMNPMTDEQQEAWINRFHASYLESFVMQRNRFSSADTGNILGIPFVFILMVNAEFDDNADNLVDLYDKLFVATFKRKGLVIDSDINNEHLNFETLAAKIYEQGDKRALISSLEEGIRVNIFAFSYYLTITRDDMPDQHDGYYEFYHRTFYEYFLA